MAVAVGGAEGGPLVAARLDAVQMGQELVDIHPSALQLLGPAGLAASLEEPLQVRDEDEPAPPDPARREPPLHHKFANEPGGNVRKASRAWNRNREPAVQRVLRCHFKPLRAVRLIVSQRPLRKEITNIRDRKIVPWSGTKCLNRQA